MATLRALAPGESCSAYTDDARTPECFVRLADGQSLELAGDDGSVQVIQGGAQVFFAGKTFAILGEYGDIFHCRTPMDHVITARGDTIIQILGKRESKSFDANRKGVLSELARQIVGTRLIRTSEEAFYTVSDLFAVGEPQMKVLRDEVGHTSRQRVRLCAHANVNAALHEMFVCYMKSTKIAPHKHLAKDESFHVLEGALDFIVYNESGDVQEIIPMGAKNSGLPFYVRVPRDTYHAVAMTSEYCILHEGTAGPFDRAHTVWATWR